MAAKGGSDHNVGNFPGPPYSAAFNPAMHQYQMRQPPVMGTMQRAGFMPGQQIMHQHLPMPPSYQQVYPRPQVGVNYPHMNQAHQMPNHVNHVTPPAYSSHMAQNFQFRHSTIAQPALRFPQQMPQHLHQSKQVSMEDEMKKRNFQDTQRKLLQLGRGGGKTDANTMIEAILGKNNPKPKHAGPVAPTRNNNMHSNGKDSFGDFGDFMQGPSDLHQNATDTETKQVPIIQDNAKDESSINSEVPSKTEPKIDIEDLMKACSDLSQMQTKAKTFVKPSVKQIQPTHQKTTTFHDSKLARKWTANGDDHLHNLFISKKESSLLDVEPVLQENDTSTSQTLAHVNDAEPVTEVVASKLPVNPSLSHVPPVFCQEASLPPVYHQVLEASLRNGVIDTGVVYSILIRSQLSREALGVIWSLANKIQPGQLIREELYLILGLIALTQNGQDVSSVAIFNKFPQALTPDLGHMQAESFTQLAASNIPNSNPATQSVPKPVTQKIYENMVSVITTEHECIKVTPAPTIGMPMKQKHFGGTQISSHPTSFNDGIGTFSKITELANKVAESANILPSPSSDNPSVPFSPNRFVGLVTEYAASKGSRSADSSSIGSFKMDSISQKSLPSSFAIEDDDSDDFDDFKSAESSDNASGTFSSNGPRLTYPTEPELLSHSDDKYAAFKEFSVTASDGSVMQKIQEPSQFLSNASDFKSEKSTLSGTSQVINNMVTLDHIEPPTAISKSPLMHLQNAPTLLHPSDNIPEAQTQLPSSPTVSSSQISWNMFSNSETGEASDFADFTQFQGADTSVSESYFSGTENRKWTDSVDKNITNIQNPPITPFGTVGTYSSKRGLQNDKNISPTNSQRNSAHFVELPDGTLREAPPELDFGEDDFTDFIAVDTSVVVHDDSELFTDTRSANMATDWMAGAHTAKSLQTKIVVNASKFDLDLNNLTISGSTAGLFSDLSNTNQLADNIKEDSQSVASLELNFGRKKDSSKDLNSLGGDTQSVCSMNSVDSGRKSNPDQTSVKSLELSGTFCISPAETPGIDSFGDFSSAEHHQTHNNDTWNKKPVDASELLSEGIMSDRYTAAAHDVTNVERHAFEWERCLRKCLEIMKNANDVFNSISCLTVCNEVIKSKQGSDYVVGVIEIYRVVKRLSFAMKVSAVTNENLRILLGDIESGWQSLTAFIEKSSLMPELPTLDFGRCVLKSNDEEAQKQACGVCLLNVDLHCKGFDREMDKHKLYYGGRQYHVTCANFWINCVDSMLPALMLPELL